MEEKDIEKHYRNNFGLNAPPETITKKYYTIKELSDLHHIGIGVLKHCAEKNGLVPTYRLKGQIQWKFGQKVAEKLVTLYKATMKEELFDPKENAKEWRRNFGDALRMGRRCGRETKADFEKYRSIQYVGTKRYIR